MKPFRANNKIQIFWACAAHTLSSRSTELDSLCVFIRQAGLPVSHMDPCYHTQGNSLEVGENGPFQVVREAYGENNHWQVKRHENQGEFRILTYLATLAALLLHSSIGFKRNCKYLMQGPIWSNKLLQSKQYIVYLLQEFCWKHGEYCRKVR